jgi:predicted transcriptional regulator
MGTRQPRLARLSRRERQIMDSIYRRGRATAAEVIEDIADPPSYSAVRATLRLLEQKGMVSHVSDGPRYVYIPTVSRREASRSALRHLVDTFFAGSAEQTFAALLDRSADQLSDEELDRMAALIDKAREGK